MCGENINVDFVEKKYNLWLSSEDGTIYDGGTSPDRIIFNLPQLQNLDPKYQSSLIFVKQFWKQLGAADAPNPAYAIYINGKSFPNNVVSVSTGVIGGGTSQIVAFVPSQTWAGENDGGVNLGGMGMIFSGNARDNGILCSDTLVNGGELDVELIGYSAAASGATSWRMNIEIQLVENTRNKKCGCS